jgi:hypothetical protein
VDRTRRRRRPIRPDRARRRSRPASGRRPPSTLGEDGIGSTGLRIPLQRHHDLTPRVGHPAGPASSSKPAWRNSTVSPPSRGSTSQRTVAPTQCGGKVSVRHATLCSSDRSSSRSSGSGACANSSLNLTLMAQAGDQRFDKAAVRWIIGRFLVETRRWLPMSASKTSPPARRHEHVAGPRLPTALRPGA